MSDDRVDNRRPPPQHSQNVSRQGNRVIQPGQNPDKRANFSNLLDQSKIKMGVVSQRSALAQTREGDRSQRAMPVPEREHERQSDKELPRRAREREPERKEDRAKGSQESDRPTAREAEKRVVGRQQSSERDQQGSKGGDQGKGGMAGQQKGGKEIAAPLAAKAAGRMAKGEIAQAAFAAKMAQAVANAKAAAMNPTVLSKEVIDQIVQYVRLMTRKDGEKEMELSLHEKIFKGLMLRVAVAKGKVEATFVASSQDVCDLFRSQKSAIREALAEKGIDVKQIDVIMA